MPIDPGVIARGMQQVQPADPMQTMMQMYQLQNMRQNQMLAQERIGLERQEQARLQAEAQRKAQDIQNLRAAGQAVNPHLRGSLKDFDIKGVIDGLSPELQEPAWTLVDTWRKEQAEINSKTATANKANEDAKAARLELFGRRARQIRAAGYDPIFSQGMLSVMSEDNPDLDVDALWETHGQDPAKWKTYVDGVIAATGQPFTLRQGEKRFDEAGGVLAEIQPEPEKGPTVGSFEHYLVSYAKANNKDPNDPAVIEEARKRYGQADDRVVVQTGGLAPRVETTVRGLSDRFSREPVVRRATTMAEAAQFVRSLDVKTKNPADQQALIYAFAKVMDPESVVREGEYATVQKYSQAWLEKLGFDAMRVINSDTPLLTPEAMQRLKNTINTRYQAALPQYRNLETQYKKAIDKATGLGLDDAGQRLIDYSQAFPMSAATNPGEAPGSPPPAAVPPPTTAPPTTGQPIKFKAPDGKTYTFQTQEQLDNFKRAAGIP